MEDRTVPDAADRLVGDILMNREEQIIKFESARNAAMDSYFEARSQLMRTQHEEKLFEAGFRMAWEVSQKLTDEIITIVREDCRNKVIDTIYNIGVDMQESAEYINGGIKTKLKIIDAIMEVMK